MVSYDWINESSLNKVEGTIILALDVDPNIDIGSTHVSHLKFGISEFLVK